MPSRPLPPPSRRPRVHGRRHGADERALLRPGNAADESGGRVRGSGVHLPALDRGNGLAPAQRARADFRAADRKPAGARGSARPGAADSRTRRRIARRGAAGAARIDRPRGRAAAQSRRARARRPARRLAHPLAGPHRRRAGGGDPPQDLARFQPAMDAGKGGAGRASR